MIVFTFLIVYVCVCDDAFRYKQLLHRKEELDELEKNLKKQQEKMALENQTHQATADECKLLKEENDRSDQPVLKVLSDKNQTPLPVHKAQKITGIPASMEKRGRPTHD